MRRRTLVGLLLAFLFAWNAVGVAGAQGSAVSGQAEVVGSPDLTVSVSDNRLPAGERVELTVTISNSGDIRRGGIEALERRVKTARNVRVSVQDGNLPLDVKTGTVVLGDVADGVPRTATFVVETEENVAPGSYSLSVRLEYDSTRIVEYLRTPTPPGYTSPRFSDFDRTVTKRAEILFEPKPRFEIVSETASGLYSGDTGTLRLTVRNDGERAARDTTVRLESGSPDVGFGTLSAPRSTASVSASRVGAGDSSTVSVGMRASPDAEPGTYPVSATVEYLNSNGVEEASRRIPLQVEVGGERRFVLEDVTTERLRVGENDAVVAGEVVNRGPATAYDVNVVASPAGALRPTGPESAVGDLEPGESKGVRFTFGVSEDAEASNRSLSFDVEYENSEGEVRRADTPIRQRVSVGEELESFGVADVNTSVNAGGDGEVRVRIRNNREHTVRRANAKMFVNSPLSSSDNSAFLGEMEPGETKTAVFKASATGDALAKEYDASLQVRYEDSTGDTELADGISFGVPVGSQSGGVPLVFVVGAVIVVVAAASVYYYRRER